MYIYLFNYLCIYMYIYTYHSRMHGQVARGRGLGHRNPEL